MERAVEGGHETVVKRLVFRCREASFDLIRLLIARRSGKTKASITAHENM